MNIDTPIKINLHADSMYKLFKFCISCLQHDDGESVGLHDHLGDVADWAQITLKQCGFSKDDIQEMKDSNY